MYILDDTFVFTTPLLACHFHAKGVDLWPRLSNLTLCRSEWVDYTSTLPEWILSLSTTSASGTVTHTSSPT